MFFAFIAPSEFASAHDPVRVLKMAASRSDLLADCSYDPDHTSLWALADVITTEPAPVAIYNERTGLTEDARVCEMGRK